MLYPLSWFTKALMRLLNMFHNNLVNMFNVLEEQPVTDSFAESCC